MVFFLFFFDIYLCSLVSGFQKNSRGVSYVFGEDAVDNFCDKLGVQLIVRAHQVVPAGFEFFARHRLLTVFSAPNYCNQFDNAAGLVMIDTNMSMRIKVSSFFSSFNPI